METKSKLSILAMNFIMQKNRIKYYSKEIIKSLEPLALQLHRGEYEVSTVQDLKEKILETKYHLEKLDEMVDDALSLTNMYVVEQQVMNFKGVNDEKDN